MQIHIRIIMNLFLHIINAKYARAVEVVLEIILNLQ